MIQGIYHLTFPAVLSQAGWLRASLTINTAKNLTNPSHFYPSLDTFKLHLIEVGTVEDRWEDRELLFGTSNADVTFFDEEYKLYALLRDERFDGYESSITIERSNDKTNYALIFKGFYDYTSTDAKEGPNFANITITFAPIFEKLQRIPVIKDNAWNNPFPANKYTMHLDGTNPQNVTYNTCELIRDFYRLIDPNANTLFLNTWTFKLPLNSDETEGTLSQLGTNIRTLFYHQTNEGKFKPNYTNYKDAFKALLFSTGLNGGMASDSNTFAISAFDFSSLTNITLTHAIIAESSFTIDRLPLRRLNLKTGNYTWATAAVTQDDLDETLEEFIINLETIGSLQYLKNTTNTWVRVGYCKMAHQTTFSQYQAMLAEYFANYYLSTLSTIKHKFKAKGTDYSIYYIYRYMGMLHVPILIKKNYLTNTTEIEAVPFNRLTNTIPEITQTYIATELPVTGIYQTGERVLETFTSADEINAYTLQAKPSSSPSVYLNGLRQNPNSDYTENAGTITFIEQPPTASTILIEYTAS